MTFEGITQERPAWFWCVENGKEEVRKVIRDGSGTLWTEVAGHGVRLDDYLKTHHIIKQLPNERQKTDETRNLP
jgi:hypothetical protein